jgi:hypothetical protein
MKNFDIVYYRNIEQYVFIEKIVDNLAYIICLSEDKEPIRTSIVIELLSTIPDPNIEAEMYSYNIWFQVHNELSDFAMTNNNSSHILQTRNSALQLVKYRASLRDQNNIYILSNGERRFVYLLSDLNYIPHIDTKQDNKHFNKGSIVEVIENNSCHRVVVGRKYRLKEFSDYNTTPDNIMVYIEDIETGEKTFTYTKSLKIVK